jgi:ABC-type multidrug transport system ATPase subunit
MAVMTAPSGEQQAVAAAAALDLRRVVSVVDGFPLLAGVDLRVEVGEVVLVSGPNGAGKTSLLRLIAGLLPVTDGHAVVLGRDLAAPGRAPRHRVALVGQETGCYDDLSVGRNLTLHARAAGVGPGRVAAVVELLQLDDLVDTAHAHLSTGQRRRCALAVGLARSAELLLLDEPHAGLDEQGRDVVDRAVVDAASAGTTVILVSHELDRARSLVGREVRLAGGCVASAF